MQNKWKEKNNNSCWKNASMKQLLKQNTFFNLDWQQYCFTVMLIYIKWIWLVAHGLWIKLKHFYFTILIVKAFYIIYSMFGVSGKTAYLSPEDSTWLSLFAPLLTWTILVCIWFTIILQKLSKLTELHKSKNMKPNLQLLESWKRRSVRLVWD